MFDDFTLNAAFEEFELEYFEWQKALEEIYGAEAK